MAEKPSLTVVRPLTAEALLRMYTSLTGKQPTEEDIAAAKAAAASIAVKRAERNKGGMLAEQRSRDDAASGG